MRPVAGEDEGGLAVVVPEVGRGRLKQSDASVDEREKRLEGRVVRGLWRDRGDARVVRRSERGGAQVARRDGRGDSIQNESNKSSRDSRARVATTPRFAFSRAPRAPRRRSRARNRREPPQRSCVGTAPWFLQRKPRPRGGPFRSARSRAFVRAGLGRVRRQCNHCKKARSRADDRVDHIGHRLSKMKNAPAIVRQKRDDCETQTSPASPHPARPRRARRSRV